MFGDDPTMRKPIIKMGFLITFQLIPVTWSWVLCYQHIPKSRISQ